MEGDDTSLNIFQFRSHFPRGRKGEKGLQLICQECRLDMYAARLRQSDGQCCVYLPRHSQPCLGYLPHYLAGAANTF